MKRLGTAVLGGCMLCMPVFCQTSNSLPVHIVDTKGTAINQNNGALNVNVISSPAGNSTVSVSNFPASQPVTGTVAVSNLPVTQPISGTVAVSNLLATQPVSGSVSVSNLPVTQPVSGTFWQATQPVSAASLPLPTGASTSAKQPALGTAGTAATDVLTVQGIASMTPLKIDGSAVTQPVSGAVSVSNFPATQPVSGTVSVSNFPASQVVSGTVAVSGTTTTRDTASSNTGSAVPAMAQYIGGIASGNLIGVTVCDKSAFLQMTTATTTQLVALVSAQKVRVCSYSIQGSTTATATTLKLVEGTGTSCATGQAQKTPAWNMPASSTSLPVNFTTGTHELFSTSTGTALCATSSAAGTVNIFLSYTQY